MKAIAPYLMFNGNAREAIRFYTTVFPNSRIIESKFDDSEVETELSPLITFALNGQIFHALDSQVKHDFSFTPAISFFITCDTEEEIRAFYEQLKQDGQELMPLDTYPFSRLFTWIEDRYGVSWQLTLE